MKTTARAPTCPLALWSILSRPDVSCVKAVISWARCVCLLALFFLVFWLFFFCMGKLEANSKQQGEKIQALRNRAHPQFRKFDFILHFDKRVFHFHFHFHFFFSCVGQRKKRKSKLTKVLFSVSIFIHILECVVQSWLKYWKIHGKPFHQLLGDRFPDLLGFPEIWFQKSSKICNWRMHTGRKGKMSRKRRRKKKEKKKEGSSENLRIEQEISQCEFSYSFPWRNGCESERTTLPKASPAKIKLRRIGS